MLGLTTHNLSTKKKKKKNFHHQNNTLSPHSFASTQHNIDIMTSHIQLGNPTKLVKEDQWHF